MPPWFDDRSGIWDDDEPQTCPWELDHGTQCGQPLDVWDFCGNHDDATEEEYAIQRAHAA